MRVAVEAKPKWRHGQGETIGAIGRETRDQDSTGTHRSLVCVRCGHHITHASAAVEHAGLHEHTQVNPGGFVWNFRCFSSAPGCVPVGPPSSEFAWFPGYTWQIEHCTGCGFHVGWLFASTDHQFYGLISERLVEVERD